ncbi:DNAJ/TPR domain-containing protein DNAJC7 family protein [Schizosaccharomyces cryophilus OY26]|uniref:DNAJ/TPR domain-containing protein DNAJC7 family protein n=1 Tax=Schizosaccharomyces cryophilus (strain OY26 / ATCC MYA-4695 / CBS 11777 / NBRC 106824 / NRRL Y48691) TaxID=653667 RepID=S9XG51_SCHCR|nr:DNAJ/TPR domain-containing protein DNAJC7 family protein [Schizosaccharomyces cryophilus OY26]EPY52636.1 DNAJ/TPR domain-containing protein DNAJC7 family protein [Schizosaccharomyces cryophilus OY26]
MTDVESKHVETPMSDKATVEQIAEEQKAVGNDYYRKKNFSEAIKAYTSAIELGTGTAKGVYYSNRAAAYMLMGEFELALSDAKQSDRYNSNVPKTHARIRQAMEGLSVLNEAEVYLKNKQGGLALNALDRLHRRLDGAAKPPALWSYLRARVYICQNDLSQAQKIALGFLRENPRNVEALVLRGQVLYYSGENAKAITHFQEALKLDPDCASAKTFFKRVRSLENTKAQGNDAFKQGKLDKAKELYSKALDIDVDNKFTNAKLYMNRATVLLKLKKPEEALNDSNKALEIDSGYVKGFKTRAKAHEALEQWEDAVRDIQSAIDLDSGDSSLRQELRRLQLELKKSQRKDHYKILGVSKNATDAEIKKAYRKMALVYHPDKNAGDEKAEAKFKEIGEAYGILSDPESRRRFDSGADLEGGMGAEGAGMDPYDILRTYQASGAGGFPGGGFGAGGFPGGGFYSQGFSTGGYPGFSSFQF